MSDACNMDCGPPGSSVPGISQARAPERVAISSSRGSGIKAPSPILAGGFFTTEPPGKPSYYLDYIRKNQQPQNPQAVKSVFGGS